MLDLQKRQLKFKYDGEDQLIRYPSVKDLSEYQEKYKEAEGKNEAGVVIEFLIDLGLNAKIANELEASHVQLIMKELTDAKKN